MPSTDPIDVVDLLQDARGALSVAWTLEPGATPRPVDAATVGAIQKGLDAVHDAERLAQSSGASGAVTAPRLALGERLFALVDGPERALARRIDGARREGRALRLVLRLRVEGALPLAKHPAALWRWELLADGRGFVALGDDGVALGLQVGEAAPGEEPPRTQGRLRILFMASSARGVRPVLDYEREEETLAEALSGFVSEGKVVLRVAEEGNLRRLKERLQREPYDVVHLTGHGELTDEGPRLVMEDASGARADVSADELLAVLRGAKRMPFLVVIASCWSTGGRPDLPSLAAQLVAGGVPSVIGWVRPVRDDVATEAARDLYERVAVGRSPLDAAADTRQHLHRREAGKAGATQAWATMQLLSRRCPGPSVELAHEEATEAPVPGETYRILGGRMRVMERGFVGRRRELQRLIRLLREGKDDDGRAVAGAVIAGMKGQGKSCLVGRAIDRHRDDVDAPVGLVVLHGALRDSEVIEAFRVCAVTMGDGAAEAAIKDPSQPVLERVERLLRGPWRARRVVIVLDDFEDNLDVATSGLAQVKPAAAALLEAVVPACAVGRPKVLVTATARFAAPTKLAGALAEVELGALEPASVMKLWLRGQEAKELEHLLPKQWEALAERLGRNARVLDWARQLMGGKTPAEVAAVVARAGAAMGDWKGRAPDEVEQARLAAVFLEQLAYEAATVRVGDGAMLFVRRARVYDVPVPVEAFAALTEGTGVVVAEHVPALANLGLLELGSDEEGGRVYRVSPLVEREFRTEEAARWHGVAARWFRGAAEVSGGLRADQVQAAWEHALAAGDQEIADWGARRLSRWLEGRGAYAESAALAQVHTARFPASVEGAHWEGYAVFRAGDPMGARGKMLRAETLAKTEGVAAGMRRAVIDSTARVLAACGDLVGATERLSAVVAEEEAETPEGTHALAIELHALAGVLKAQGDLPGARARLERSLEIKRKVLGTEEHPSVAASLHALAGVLKAQGDLPGARARLERSLEIKRKVLGTEEHPSVAASLHALAGVLKAQGDLPGARARLERSLEIKRKVLGTEEHPDVAASLHELAGVLQAQGDLPGARARLERSLEIQRKVLGTEEHPDVAASLHELAGVLKAQGDLPGARARLERSLEIKRKVLGTEEHPDVAASLHALAGVLQAQGDLPGARARLERSLEIQRKVLGTEEHPDVAASLHALAGVLKAQGDLPGARARLERSLEIKRKVLGTEEHPSVAASLHELANVLLAEGKADEAVATWRRVLDIEARVFGTLDQYHSAETEFVLGKALLDLSRPAEALPLLRHAMHVFRAQVPGHPWLRQLEALFAAPTSPSDPRVLARAALQARASKTPPPPDFAEGLDALRAAGEPHDAVAAQLDAVAQGAALPAIPEALPEPVRAFLARVHDAARALPAP